MLCMAMWPNSSNNMQRLIRHRIDYQEIIAGMQ